MERQYPFPAENSLPAFPKFRLNKKLSNKYLISFLTYAGIILIIYAVSITIRPTITPANPKLGDSQITNLLIKKELQQLNTKPVQTREDLELISKKKDLGFAFYRILPGENLSSVAYKFGLSMATVLSLNSLDNAHSLSVGQKILLPTRSGILYNTTNKTSAKEIAERHGISAEDIILVNQLQTDTIEEGRTLFLPNANLTFKEMTAILGFDFINPVPRYRRISSHFGMRRHPILKRRILHTGIDFAAPTGTPIVAAKEGRVISAGWMGGYGLATVIRHNNGYTTLYGHQSRITIKAGQWVSTGQHIGNVGNTGRSTGPHLHFEIRKYGQYKNPLQSGLQLR